jgi:16S rRNA processing protein RimM
VPADGRSTQRTGASDYMVMGRIIAPYGVKGWVKVHAYTEVRSTLLDYAAWWIRPRAGSEPAAGGWREYAVEASREHGATLIAQLAGIGDREAANVLKGADIGVPRASVPATAANEIYYSDLVGLEVTNRQGTRIGTVSKVQDFGAHPVLCVTDEATAAERMIPFVAAYVDGVDLAAGRIEVDWQLDY